MNLLKDDGDARQGTNLLRDDGDARQGTNLLKDDGDAAGKPLLGVDGQGKHLLDEGVDLLRRQLVEDGTELSVEHLRQRGQKDVNAEY